MHQGHFNPLGFNCMGGVFIITPPFLKGVGVLNIQGYGGILEFIISYIVLNSSNARNH
nr:MAG TPA: hypothetical protein [Caudoviricetes sp.]